MDEIAECSDATTLRGTNAVVRLRSDVGDGTDFESSGLERTDGGLTTGTRALHKDIDLLDAVFHGLAGRGLGRHASGVRSGLTGALESDIAPDAQDTTAPDGR